MLNSKITFPSRGSSTICINICWHLIQWCLCQHMVELSEDSIFSTARDVASALWRTVWFVALAYLDHCRWWFSINFLISCKTWAFTVHNGIHKTKATCHLLWKRSLIYNSTCETRSACPVIHGTGQTMERSRSKFLVGAAIAYASFALPACSVNLACHCTGFVD